MTEDESELTTRSFRKQSTVTERQTASRRKQTRVKDGIANALPAVIDSQLLTEAPGDC